MRKAIFALILLAMLVLSSVLAAAKPLGSGLTDIFDLIMDVIGYVFGMKFLVGITQNIKVQIITRLSVFLIMLILMYELFHWRGHGLSSGSAKTIAFALALMTSFAIGPTTLSTIAGLWGGLIALMLFLAVILILYAIVYVIPSTSTGPILLKIFILFLILIIMNTQSELIADGKLQQENRLASGSPKVSTIAGSAVLQTPLYYPQRYPYPEQYRGR